MKKCWLIHLTCPQGHCPGTFWDHCNLTACTAPSRVGLALNNFGSYGTFLLILVEQGGRCIFQSQMFPFYTDFLQSTPFHRTSWAVSQFTRTATAKAPACKLWQHSITDDDITALIMSPHLHFHECYNIRIFSITTVNIRGDGRGH